MKVWAFYRYWHRHFLIFVRMILAISIIKGSQVVEPLFSGSTEDGNIVLLLLAWLSQRLYVNLKKKNLLIRPLLKPPCLKRFQESVILLNETFIPFFTYCGLKKISLPYMIRKVFINMKGFPHLSQIYLLWKKMISLILHFFN